MQKFLEIDAQVCCRANKHLFSGIVDSGELLYGLGLRIVFDLMPKLGIAVVRVCLGTNSNRCWANFFKNLLIPMDCDYFCFSRTFYNFPNVNLLPDRSNRLVIKYTNYGGF